MIHKFFAQAFDVHGAPSGKVQQGLFALRRAEQATRTTMIHGTTLANHAACTRWADCGHAKVEDIGGARCWHATHHLRDDVASAADDDAVAHPHTFATQLEDVVQAGVAHRGAGHEYRRQLGHRGELACAPDLGLNAQQSRELLLRRVLVRHRPSWLAGHETQALLKREVVDFVNHSVNVKEQGIAPQTHACMKRYQTIGALRYHSIGTDRHSPSGQGIQHFAVGGRHGPTKALTQAIGKKTQWPLRRNVGVELAYRPRRRVARVHKGFFVLLALRTVHGVEVGTAHVDLATDLQRLWRRADKTQRNLPDGANVLCHVFTALAVAASCGLDQYAVLVTQVDGQPVEFELGSVLNGWRRVHEFKLTPDAPVKSNSARSSGVGLGPNAQHRQFVLDGNEAVQHLAQNALCGRVGR